jgi:hypothetical protein
VLEPAVLGFLPAGSLRQLLRRLGARLPDVPWYAQDVDLPPAPFLPGVRGAWAAVVDPAEFNARTRTRNKSDLLFEIACRLIRRIRTSIPGPHRFLVGKQGGRHFYREGLRRRVCRSVRVREESPARSAYEIEGGWIDFLQDAEDRHELVALASMVGKYLRERAMGLFNAWWAAQVEGLRPTAGYGADGRRFWRDIAAAAGRLGIAAEAVCRLR